MSLIHSGGSNYLSDGPRAASYRTVIKDEANLLIPTVCLYEVFKITLGGRVKIKHYMWPV